MKKGLLLFAIFFISIAQSQIILIPNGGFDSDTSGWSIVGDNTTISGGGELYINVSGIYTEDFVLTSPQFNLEANKTYKLHGDYRNILYDPMMGETPLGGFSNISLKDVSGNNAAVVGLTNCNIGYLDMCYSNNFTVPTSGTYYLEFVGQQQQDAEFVLDNVGFEEIIQNTFSGKVTLDVNNDGCTTSTTTVSNFPIQLNETNSNTSYNVFTDVNGNYIVENQNITGNFVTQTNQALYNSTPANYTNNISSGTNNITNQNFCISPNTVANDLNVSIIPSTQARPGFNTSYQLRYTNLGTTTLSGNVDLSFDNTLVTFLNASTSPDVINPASLSWNYSNLLPLETRYIDVSFNIFTPPTVNNGDVLSYTISVSPITGDYTPTNNTYTFNQITIGSYDPNDITILEGPLLSTSQASEYLNILIRFQNTGTASAINITVKNSLDAFLDWSTFQPIAASHNYNTIVNNGNEVDFVFNNINLSDSTSDEPGSHGWVYYKIKPKNTFNIGDVISSIAKIYFDYNLPIITNTATTQIDNTLSILENEIDTDLNIYPNPASHILNITSNRSRKYSLFNLNGQLIESGKFNSGENHLDISNLSNGLYILKTTTLEGSTFAKKVYIKQQKN